MLSGLLKLDTGPRRRWAISAHRRSYIGAQDRLDFTVIGAAVNEASRIEGLCKVTGKSLLMSDAFVQRLPDAERARTTSAGKHAVKGVAQPVAVHTTIRAAESAP